MEYLQLNLRETVFIQRTDATSSTMLRKEATKSHSDGVWVDSRACVANGEAVIVIRYATDFSYVQTDRGECGFINSNYLTAGTVLARSDGGGKTMLRGKADPARDPSVWEKRYTCVGEGQRIQLIKRETTSASSDFWIVRTTDGVEGFLQAKYAAPLLWARTGSGWALIHPMSV